MISMASMHKKVVVITGASSGIGKELALQFAQLNYKVGFLARRKQLLDEVSEEIRNKGGECLGVECDVRNPDEVKKAFYEITRQLGDINLLIANAAVSKPTSITEFSGSDIGDVMQTNFLGVIYSIEQVLPSFIQNQDGHIVVISSVAAYKPLPKHESYCASKAALNSFMGGLRTDVRNYNIKVTTVCPGFVETAMSQQLNTMKPFIMNADVAATKIIRAILKEKKTFNFPWPTYALTKLSNFLPDSVVMRFL